MTTAPLIEEPSRFGSPLEPLATPSWVNFRESPNVIHECRVLLWPEEGGGYCACVMRLPNIVSEGDTCDEVMDRIQSAFREAILTYREGGESIPWTNAEPKRPHGSFEKWVLVDIGPPDDLALELAAWEQASDDDFEQFEKSLE